MNENKCQVVDQQRPFCMIDYAVLDDMRLSGIDLNVYAALKRWANANRECWPSAKKIAEKARTSERSCFRSLKHLEELGFVAGGAVTVVAAMGGNVIVKVKESRIAISEEMARRIMI